MLHGMAKGRKRKKKSKKHKVSGVLIACVTIAFVFVSVLVSNLVRYRAAGDETGAVLPEGKYTSFAIDLSHHNSRNIDWSNLRVLADAQGRTVRTPQQAKDIYPVKCVFMKATEGLRSRDRSFRQRWEEAGKTDIRRGAYHFFNTSRDGAAQARNFIEAVPSIPFRDLPPVLDIETIHRGCSRQELNRKLRDFLSTVEQHYGRKPIIYTSDSFLKDHIDQDIRDGYPIWIARYNSQPPSFKNWILWQFTDRAIVSGVPGLIDLSIIQGALPL